MSVLLDPFIIMQLQRNGVALVAAAQSKCG